VIASPKEVAQQSPESDLKRRNTWAGGLTLALFALTACGESATTADPPPFEAAGNWLYLGPSDIPHTLTITNTSMKYTDVEGAWSSTWKITTYDNGLHHFQVTLDNGVGAYLPMGQSMSGAYDKGPALLTVQLASGSSYPALQGVGTCTADASGTPLPNCRLYVKQ
jgi:hypothetical protein